MAGVVVWVVAMVSCPVKPTPTLGDENTNCAVQLCPDASVNGAGAQLPPGAIAKRGLAESTVKLIATSLLLLSVTVCGGLVAVTVVVKLSAAGKML